MTTKERLRDIDLANDTHKPVGAFTVELSDSRTGKVLERQRQSNYITPVYERLVRWYQGALFHNGTPFVSNGVQDNRFKEAAGAFKELGMPPHFPIEGMFALDSSVPENTDSDWATGRTVGYGYRWRSAEVTASGKRGQLNDAQCLLSRDLVRLVWDFNENQGNGTFASLAIGRGTEEGNLICAYSPEGTLELNGDYDHGFYAGDPSWTLFRPRIAGMDATNVYVVYSSPTTSTIRVATLPLSAFTDTSAYTDGLVSRYSGATPSEIVLDGQTVTTSTSDTDISHYYRSRTAVAKDGTGFIVAYYSGSATLRISRFDSAGDRTHTLAIAANTNAVPIANPSVSILGSFAYVTSDYDDGTPLHNTQIYKINLTSFTLDSTIPLAGDTVVSGTHCLIGSDLYVQTNEGIYRYQTSDGAYVENYGSIVSPAFSEQGLTPYITSSEMYGLTELGLRDVLWSYRGHKSASTNGDMFTGFYQDQTGGLSDDACLLSDGTKLYAFDSRPPNTAANALHVHPIVGGNAFSRSVLESPINKTSSSTMKWTYELTLPASWYSSPGHPVPPAPG